MSMSTGGVYSKAAGVFSAEMRNNRHWKMRLPVLPTDKYVLSIHISGILPDIITAGIITK